MTCAGNTKDYIERKLAGEDVISPGSLYGYMALSEGLESDAFLVLDIDFERMSFYRYVSKSGRIRIVDYREDVSHAITELLDATAWLDAARLMMFYQFRIIATYPLKQCLMVSRTSSPHYSSHQK